MYENYEYYQYDYRLFPGFYHSIIFDGEELSEIESRDREEGIINENQYYEVNPRYFKKISEIAVDLLFEYIKEDKIINKMTFKELNSPNYYNYETDKLIINLSIDFDKLKEWAIEFENELKQYVKDRYSSRPGFNSFVKYEDIDQFFARWTDIVIDFYLITNMDIPTDEYDPSEYDYNLTEAHYDLLYGNLTICEYTSDQNCEAIN